MISKISKLTGKSNDDIIMGLRKTPEILEKD